MSIWADIQDRSSGELDRKEDQLEKVVKELKTAMNNDVVEKCIHKTQWCQYDIKGYF